MWSSFEPASLIPIPNRSLPPTLDSLASNRQIGTHRFLYPRLSCASSNWGRRGGKNGKACQLEVLPAGQRPQCTTTPDLAPGQPHASKYTPSVGSGCQFRQGSTLPRLDVPSEEGSELSSVASNSRLVFPTRRRNIGPPGWPGQVRPHPPASRASPRRRRLRRSLSGSWGAQPVLGPLPFDTVRNRPRRIQPSRSHAALGSAWCSPSSSGMLSASAC